MESFYGWIQDITVYMILVTLIYKLSVNSSYKPYIKLVTGLLMIVLIAKPVVSLGNGDFKTILQQETIDYQVESARISQEIYEEQRKKIIPRNCDNYRRCRNHTHRNIRYTWLRSFWPSPYSERQHPAQQPERR